MDIGEQCMRIGLAPYRFINSDVEYNICQVEKALKEASSKVDMLLFGETFLQGFDALTWEYNKDALIAVSQHSPEMQRLARYSATYNTAIGIGYIERDADVLFSSYAVFSEGTLMYNYRRISKGWKEYGKTDSHYQEGKTIEHFELQGERFGVALCGDVWDYPEKFKTENILIWPVYVNFSLADWKKEETEYAKQVAKVAPHVLMINSLSDNPVSHGGAFYFTSGYIVSQMDYDREQVLIIDDIKVSE